MIRIACSQYDLMNVLDVLKSYDDLLYTVHNACGDKNLAFVYINDYDNECVDDFFENMELFICAVNQLVFDGITEHIYVKIGNTSFELDGNNEVRDSALKIIQDYVKYLTQQREIEKLKNSQLLNVILNHKKEISNIEAKIRKSSQ